VGVFSAVIVNNYAGNRDVDSEVVDAVLAEMVKAWLWCCYSTLQTCCHIAPPQPSASFCLPHAAPFP
jgi:hypothetical protein